MFIAKRYPEGKFPPKRGSRSIWHVHCMTGAIQVLRDPEFLKALEDNPRDSAKILFDDESAALVSPGDELWEELLKFVAGGFKIAVFPFIFKARYVPWTGAPTDAKEFDAVEIRKS